MSDTPGAMDVRTLYVEDDEVVRELTAELLGEMRLAVTSAGSAAEAISFFDAAPADAPFELLVTDIGLPDLPGMDLARQLAARAPELRIVFSSGYPLPRRPPGWDGRAASVDKPIDLETPAAVQKELGVDAA